MIQNCHLPRDVQTQILEFLLDYLNHQIHNLMQDIHSAQKKDFKSTMQILCKYSTFIFSIFKEHYLCLF